MGRLQKVRGSERETRNTHVPLKKAEIYKKGILGVVALVSGQVHD